MHTFVRDSVKMFAKMFDQFFNILVEMRQNQHNAFPFSGKWNRRTKLKLKISMKNPNYFMILPINNISPIQLKLQV